MGKFNVPASLMGAVEERNVLRTDGFRLFDGFEGDYTVEGLQTRKLNSDEVNAFTIRAKHATLNKNLMLPDYVFLNARVVKDTVEFAKMNNTAVGFRDENEALIAASQLLNAKS